MEYDNEMKGVLFHNKKKTTDKQPDFRGEMTVEGVRYQLAGWKYSHKTYGTYLSLKLSPWGDAGRSGSDSDASEIPF